MNQTINSDFIDFDEVAKHIYKHFSANTNIVNIPISTHTYNRTFEHLMNTNLDTHFYIHSSLYMGIYEALSRVA